MHAPTLKKAFKLKVISFYFNEYYDLTKEIVNKIRMSICESYEITLCIVKNPWSIHKFDLVNDVLKRLKTIKICVPIYVFSFVYVVLEYIRSFLFLWHKNYIGCVRIYIRVFSKTANEFKTS